MVAVKFERGLVTLYRRKSLLQKVDLCELPAIVTYEKLEADDDSISLKEFIDHLKQTCRRINAEFISYDSERKVLKFKVWIIIPCKHRRLYVKTTYYCYYCLFIGCKNWKWTKDLIIISKRIYA